MLIVYQPNQFYYSRNKAGKKNLSKPVDQDGDKMQINFRGVLFLLILLMLVSWN